MGTRIELNRPLRQDAPGCLVAGAGPAGIAALRSLPADALCLEGTGRLGGLCDTWTVGGQPFDLGGHFVHPNDHTFIAAARAALVTAGHGFVEQKRRAFVHFGGKYLPYPFQHHVGWLDATIRRRCIDALEIAPPERIETLADELEARFGREVLSLFLAPYMRKSWGIAPDQLASIFANDRIEGSPRERMRVMWSTSDEHAAKRNSVVLYPDSGAFGHMFEALADGVCSRIRTGAPVTQVDYSRRHLTVSSNASLAFEQLVSSLPLDVMIDWFCVNPPVGVSAVPDRPSFTAAASRLVALVYDRRDEREWHRLYFAEDDVPFHKLCLHHNDAPILRARGMALFLAETHPDRTSTAAAAAPACDAAIRRLQLVPRDARLTAHDVREVKRAYPLCRPGERALYDRWIDLLATHGVHAVGRWGQWRYLNSDETFSQATRVAKALAMA